MVLGVLSFSTFIGINMIIKNIVDVIIDSVKTIK